MPRPELDPGFGATSWFKTSRMSIMRLHCAGQCPQYCILDLLYCPDMTHAQSVIPKQVPDETPLLVNKPRRVIERHVDPCSTGCLRFYTSTRDIHSASAHLVIRYQHLISPIFRARVLTGDDIRTTRPRATHPTELPTWTTYAGIDARDDLATAT